MVYLSTASEWLSQSSLLLKARPTTTQITTKYNIKHALDPSSSSKKPRKTKALPPSTTTETLPDTSTTQAPLPEPIRATLVLTTHDSWSGASLKYKTTKQAEVSRLIQILGRLARGMSGLPELEDVDVKVEDVKVKEEEGGAMVGVESGKMGQQGGGGGKKKKKGKK